MAGKIKVFYLITSSDFGGAETLFYQQALLLDPARFELLLCSVKPKGEMASALEKKGVRVESLNFDWRSEILRPWRLASSAFHLSRLIRSFQPQILHTSLFQANVLGVLAGWSSGVPARIATVHMVLKKKCFELVLERLLSFAVTKYVAISKNMRDICVRRFFWPPAKVAVLLNAVDPLEIEQRSRQKPATLASLNFSFPWVVMVGRLDAQKGLGYLLKALRLVWDRGHRLGLAFIGDGPQRRGLEAATRELGLSDAVRFMGFEANPMPYLAQSRALVLSSLEEGLPLVILEAMALEKPVVATSVGAVPEAVEHGRTGLLVPAKDAEALAEAMISLIQNQDRARVMGEEGRKLLEKVFSLEAARQRLEALYAETLSDAGLS
ncbi:MAG: glycosyltransferase family 4 protein [Elusimicrobia bacterium]|nr:glycosyltransferase family 4 protein [Elusimicrobiota bacterium]